MKHCSRLSLIALAIALLAACGQPASTQPQRAAPTPTQAPCFYTYAYEAVPEEELQQTKQALERAGISARMTGSMAFGESYCAEFLHMYSSIDLTVEVVDTHDEALLAELAAQISRIVQKHVRNGQANIRFSDERRICDWIEEQKSCV